MIEISLENIPNKYFKSKTKNFCFNIYKKHFGCELSKTPNKKIIGFNKDAFY